MRKKIFSVLLALSVFAALALCASAETFLVGDANGDGKISAADARIVLRVSAKIETFNENQTAVCDTNGDGKISASDARKILRMSAHIDPSLGEITLGNDEPTTAEPTTAQPTTAEPTTAQPTTAEPTTAEPATAEPTTAEPVSQEPVSEEPVSEEPVSEEPVTQEPSTDPIGDRPYFDKTETTYDELPEQVKVFMSGIFGFSGNADGEALIMYTDGSNINMSMTTSDGSSGSITVEMLVLNTGKTPECYIRSSDTMKYHKFSNFELKLYDLSVDDVTGSFEAVDPESITMTVGNITVGNIEYTVYSMIDDNSIVDIYMLESEIKSIVCYNSDGILTERLNIDEFYTQVPDNAFSLKGYTNSLSIMDVFF